MAESRPFQPRSLFDLAKKTVVKQFRNDFRALMNLEVPRTVMDALMEEHGKYDCLSAECVLYTPLGGSHSYCDLTCAITGLAIEPYFRMYFESLRPNASIIHLIRYRMTPNSYLLGTERNLALEPEVLIHTEHKYGYLDSNETSLTNNIKDAITRFQETFGLQVTGYENEETLKLMDTPRCGNSDEGIAPFSVNPLVKWNSTRVTWNMIGSGIQYANIVERAFSLYSKHSALEFRRSYSNPTIMVVISPKKHVAYYLKSTCSYDFDGPGGVLGHAFLPRPWLNQSDIHLDFEEDWDFTMNIPAPEKTSFFTVMVHEIGHALGLQHSSVLRSVMFPSYYQPSGINNLYEFDLDRDDQLAIQVLYGPPVPSSSSSTSTT
ncbi:matrilysin-like [Homalodisca vitripennis]|uniref:matrilysin-like n=1 Tax=Homalodisca vitripennis TaxID=197043 RepID=UPI001EEB274C|nr:matrilysin-like [Homalodisca vitripennis]